MHEVLGVDTRYRIRFPRMVEYGFTNGVDYVEFEEKADVQNCTRDYMQKNHAIKYVKNKIRMRHSTKRKEVIVWKKYRK